jgi:general secretion pathway protein M
MNAYLVQLREWLAQLAPRERLFVLIGAAVVALTILFVGIWEPLLHAHARRAQALDASRVVATQLEVAAAELQRSRAGGGVNRNASLLSAVDQSSHSPTLGKAPSRIQPEGEGDKGVNVWIEDVPFDNLVRWMNDLERSYGIVAKTADIQRQPGAGLVNAHLTLARP